MILQGTFTSSTTCSKYLELSCDSNFQTILRQQRVINSLLEHQKHYDSSEISKTKDSDFGFVISNSESEEKRDQMPVSNLIR